MCFPLSFLHCARAGADALGDILEGEKGAGNGAKMSVLTLSAPWYGGKGTV